MILSPTIILVKILLQRPWVIGLERNQEVSPEIRELWTQHHGSLMEMASIPIPRWLSKDMVVVLKYTRFVTFQSQRDLYARSCLGEGPITDS